MKQAVWFLGVVSCLNLMSCPGQSLAVPMSPDAPIDPSGASSVLANRLCVDPDPLTCADGDADPMAQVSSVEQLSDVQPTDWAYQALRSLVERYGVVSGYADGQFRGNRPLSRAEFATMLNLALQAVTEQVQSQRAQVQEDLATIRRLQRSYQTIYGSLRDRTDQLTADIRQLETQQFSTTTHWSGQVVGALTDSTSAKATVPARVRLNFDTSFQGTDILRTQLEAGNAGEDAVSRAHQRRPNQLGTLGVLADGGGLDYVGVSDRVRISKLYYQFQPLPNLSLTVGARLAPRDVMDFNRFATDPASAAVANFNSSFFLNNPLIVQNAIDRPGGAGVAVAWQPTTQMPLILRALYIAGQAGQPRPARDGQGGWFSDPYQGSVELEYAFDRALVARLQYTTAKINGTQISAGGINLEWLFDRQIGVFGRFGVASYDGYNLQLERNLSLTPLTWAVGVTVRNIVIPGSIAGLAIGQPFVEKDLGNATQTNMEAYYSFLLNDNVSFSPALILVTHPNNERRGSILEWVIRMVYSF